MAIGPINYTELQAQPNVLQNFTQGLQAGNAVQQLQAQQSAQQLAPQQAELYNKDVASALQNPTPQNFAALALKYPQQREAIKQSWETQSEGERKAQGDAASQAYSALLGGRPDIAKQVVQSRIDALTNAGQDAAAEKNILSILDTNPQQAQAALGFTLSHIGDPKAFASQFGSLGQETRAAAAEPAKQQLTQEEILTAQQKRKLAELDAQIAAADSETKRGQLQLERDKFVAEQGIKGQTQAQEAQGALDTANTLVDTIKRVANHPGLEAGTGTLQAARSFFDSSDAADFQRQVESLKSQAFLNELGKLKAAGVSLGQVTEAEGTHLQNRIANLTFKQSTPAFRNQVNVLLKDTQKFINKIVGSGKLPQSGGGFVATVPGRGKITEGDINRMMAANPGSTREQALQYIKKLQEGQ